MKKKGRMIYVTPPMLEEVNSIMQECNIQKRCKAQEKLVEYARVGREAEKIFKYMTFKPVNSKKRKHG